MSGLIALRQLAFGLCFGDLGDELDLVGYVLELLQRTVEVGEQGRGRRCRQSQGQRQKVERQERKRRENRTHDSQNLHVPLHKPILCKLEFLLFAEGPDELAGRAEVVAR